MAAAPPAAPPQAAVGGVEAGGAAQQVINTAQPINLDEVRQRKEGQARGVKVYHDAIRFFFMSPANPNSSWSPQRAEGADHLRRGAADLVAGDYPRNINLSINDPQGNPISYNEGIKVNELVDFLEDQRRNGADQAAKDVAEHHLRALSGCINNTPNRLAQQNPLVDRGQLIDARIQLEEQALLKRKADHPNDPLLKDKTPAQIKRYARLNIQKQIELNLPEVTADEEAALKAHDDAEREAQLSHAAFEFGEGDNAVLREALMALVEEKGYELIKADCLRIYEASTTDDQKPQRAAMLDMLMAISDKEVRNLQAEDATKNEKKINSLRLRIKEWEDERKAGPNYENVLGNIFGKLHLETYYENKGLEPKQIASLAVHRPLDAIQGFMIDMMENPQLRKDNLANALAGLNMSPDQIKDINHRLAQLDRSKKLKNGSSAIGAMALLFAWEIVQAAINSDKSRG